MAKEFKRMQIHRGSRSLLPQSLSAGEFGLCLDTKELFVGANREELGIAESGFIRISSSAYNARLHANYTIENFIYCIVLTNPSISEDDIASITDVNVVNGFNREFFKSGNRLYIAYEYKYTGGLLDLPSMPSLGIGTTSILSALFGLSRFQDYGLDLTTIGFSVADAQIIASLINFSYVPPSGEKSGLVTMMQNLKVVTEQDGYYSTPVYFDVPIASTNSTLVKFDRNEYQSYIIEYSAYNQASNFLQTGTMSLSCLPSTTVTSLNVVMQSSINPTSANLTFTGTNNSGITEIRYTSLIPLKIQLRVRKWKSI